MRAMCFGPPSTKVFSHLLKKKYNRADLAGGECFWADALWWDRMHYGETECLKQRCVHQQVSDSSGWLMLMHFIFKFNCPPRLPRSILIWSILFTHRDFYTQSLLHTYAFTHRRFLHTDAFTHKHFYTQTLLHTEAFTHRRFYIQTLFHTNTFTHKHFYTQTLLHTEAFTHRRF